MQRRYETVDVFTDRLFGGNPLAVVLDAQALSTAQMQAIAREFNYSETSFVLPPADPAHHARVRIFTPGQELPFAGHPNVGTAYVLARTRPDPLPDVFLFEEAAGIVPVRLLRDATGVTGAEFTAPALLHRSGRFEPDAVARCLGLAPDEILVARHPPEIVSVGLAFLAVELTSRAALRRARADASALAALLPAGIITAGIYLYTRAVDPAEAGTDLQARMFAPGEGIDEDPATGSATAAVGALQAALLPEPDALLSLSVGQGMDMGRPSLLQVRATKRNGTVDSVQVGGRCVPVMAGSFRLDGTGAD